MKKNFLVLVISIFLLPLVSMAQPDLPNVAQLSKDGVNILSWINPYTANSKDVLIERSNALEEEYTVIGKIEEVQLPTQYFTDIQPLPGDNYYRVLVVFKTGHEWRSNDVHIYNAPETLSNSKVISKDSVEHLVKTLGVVREVEPTIVDYKTSPYVYVNPFNGNVNIELNDALEEWYKIIFYDENNKVMFEIPRVNDVFIILDKRNFQKFGLYKFKIYKNDEVFADGYVSIY